MDDITVRGVTYEVQHTSDRHGEDIWTIEAMPGIEARMGFEEDTSFADPRDHDNVGTIAVSYRNYILGDEDISRIDFEVECEACGGTGETYGPENMEGRFTIKTPDCPTCQGIGYVTLDPVTYFQKDRGARVVLPLTVYEHGGITMSAGHVRFPLDPQGWDTSFVGFVFDTPEMVKACIGDDATDDQIEAALRGEIEEYASYLEGDVTWWSVQDDETAFHESCGGYVGSHDYCQSECRSALESAVEARLAEVAERAEMAARGMVTR
jgi:hypothetical protein